MHNAKCSPSLGVLTKRWYIILRFGDLWHSTAAYKGVADSSAFRINSVIAVSQMCNTMCAQ